MTEAVNILGFAASLRKRSYNRAALRAAVDLTPAGIALDEKPRKTGGGMEETTRDKMSAAVILTTTIAVGVLAGAAWAAPKESPGPAFEWKDGAEVYAKVCALCHETSVGPTLRGRDLDPTYIKLIVRRGNRAMPAFRASEIDDASLEKLSEYVSKTAADK